MKAVGNGEESDWKDLEVVDGAGPRVDLQVDSIDRQSDSIDTQIDRIDRDWKEVEVVDGAGPRVDLQVDRQSQIIFIDIIDRVIGKKWRWLMVLALGLTYRQIVQIDGTDRQIVQIDIQYRQIEQIE